MNMRALLAAMALLGISNAAFGNEIDNRFIKARTYLETENLTITTTIEMAFSQDTLLVVGEGLPKKGSTGGQRRLTAITAAKVVAQRRLTEMLEGVTIVKETTVKDSEVASEVIKTAVSGFIRGTQVVIEDWNKEEETALVILKVSMSGPKSFGAMMYEKILSEPGIINKLDKTAYHPPAAIPLQATLELAYDGLIIDASEQNFRPALINRIFTANGEVIYDPAKISQKVLVEQGCGEYSNSIHKARAALELRGVKSPLIIKASGTISAADLQVSDNDAAKIFSANQKSAFFAGAKVAFVLK